MLTQRLEETLLSSDEGFLCGDAGVGVLGLGLARRHLPHGVADARSCRSWVEGTHRAKWMVGQGRAGKGLSGPGDTRPSLPQALLPAAPLALTILTPLPRPPPGGFLLPRSLPWLPGAQHFPPSVLPFPATSSFSSAASKCVLPALGSVCARLHFLKPAPSSWTLRPGTAQPQSPISPASLGPPHSFRDAL